MKYFSIKELTASDTAVRRKIDNSAGEEVVAHLTALVDNVLDPLREAWGGPIRVNSGYRCPVLNRAVGGVANSHHLGGYAADITVGGVVENRKLFRLLTIKSGLRFTQAILENGGAWIHVSYMEGNLKRQVIYA